MKNSIIEEDLTIEGNVKSEEGNVEVKGRVVGDVAAKSVVIRVSGSIDGAVKATSVTVEVRHEPGTWDQTAMLAV